MSTNDDIQLEPIYEGDYKPPFNGSLHLSYPIKILEDLYSRRLNHPEFMILSFIMSRYGWKNIIPPIVTNKDISEFLNIKDSSTRAILSKLKKYNYIVPEGYGNNRVIRIPLYEKMLTDYYSKQK